MPRLVRRTPLLERLKAYLDPYDFLLWLSEELNDDSYDEVLKAWAVPIGVGLNFLFIVARGASRPGESRGRDDVFGDFEGRRGSGWFAWFASFLVHSLTLLCCLNAFYTFYRKRHYRLFEQPIDAPPTTPSAHRVRVDSSPMSSSPLRFLQSVISSTTASSRAHPDAERDVWELGVWDPKPLHLTLFTLFSPGHVLLYSTLLPPAPMDPRPSVTVVTAICFGALLSLQLVFLKTAFSQQAKDSSLIHSEVMSEYDTKYVRATFQKPVRDVGVQTRETATSPRGTRTREVDVYTPTTIVNRGFKVNPNPNYAAQYDPDNLRSQPELRRDTFGLPRSTTTPVLRTPVNGYTQKNGYTQSAYGRPSTASADFSSPLKPHHERPRSPVKGDGGSLGVFSHAASPLRKAASSSYLRPGLDGQDEGDRARRGGSPLKRMSTPGGGADFGGGRRREIERF